MAESRTRRRPALRSAAAVVAVAVALGAAFVARAYAADDPTSGYRTTKAMIGSVDQRLGFTGTVQRVDQQTATFAASGQVSSVDVAVGQSVRKGQLLAHLDAADLEDAVVQAKASLARARATLESDQSGSSATTSSSQGGTTALSALPAALMIRTTVATPNPTRTDTKSSQGQAVPEGVRKAQAAVAAAQAKVAAAQQAATTALAAADDSCADVLDGTEPTPTTTPTGTSTTSQPPDPTTTTATSTPSSASPTADDTAALASCLKAMRTAQAALHAVTAVQDSVSAAQDRLATAQQAWAQAVARQAKAATQTPTASSSGGRTGATGQTGSSGGSGNPSTSGTGSQADTGSRSGSTDSASRIASDEASVTQAELALKQAQTALGQATLTAPVAGTVAAVGLTVGESAGSNGITIIGGSGATVTVDVPVASIPKIAVGQEADVTPPGAVAEVKGTVQQVGLLPTQTSGSAATYPVVVLVAEATATLASGARASVSILVGSSPGVVTVPNSAITTVSVTAAFVTIVKGGVATRTPVTLGTVGPTRSQVTKGLRAGDSVLLADASEPIPTSTTQNRPGGFTGGGFTGGGFSGGGFSGGGAAPAGPR